MVIFHSLCKRLPEGNIHPNLTTAHMAIYIYEKKTSSILEYMMELYKSTIHGIIIIQYVKNDS